MIWRNSCFILLALFSVVAASNSYGKIPEPDNIIYGVAREDATVLTLKVNGEEIASYTMGSTPSAGAYYILRVPIDSVDPQEPGTARPGDTADIFINGETIADASVTIGPKGSITKLHLARSDRDSDGITDIYEEEGGTNPSISDTDGDGLLDGDETQSNPLKFDSDGDGYSDGYEIEAGTNPDDELDKPVIYVDGASQSVTEDGSETNPFKTIAAGIAAATAKHTVLVAAGVYEESLTINKEIKLVGSSPLTTILDAGGSANAVIYTLVVDGISSIEKFIIQNAATGINCSNGSSPHILNNIVTQMTTNGILLGAGSSAKIYNNTISNNSDALGMNTFSNSISAVNNIVSGNTVGFNCVGITAPHLEFNNVWNNTDNYINCAEGLHATSHDPLFLATQNGDFRLLASSPSVDGGDPVEILAIDYVGMSSLEVNSLTNVQVGDRIWVTNGKKKETDIVTAVTPTTIDIGGELLNPYLISTEAYVYTETSDTSNESIFDNSRIDVGAFGNTPNAGGFGRIRGAHSRDTDRIVILDAQRFPCCDSEDCLYEWDLGGIGQVVGGNGSTVLVAEYDTEADYLATLTCTDSINSTVSSDSVTVTAKKVSIPFPPADFATIVNGPIVTVNATLPANVTELTVFWGDRTRTTYFYPLQQTISHFYTRTGVYYNIRIKMLDADGNEYNYTFINNGDLSVSIP